MWLSQLSFLSLKMGVSSWRKKVTFPHGVRMQRGLTCAVDITVTVPLWKEKDQKETTMCSKFYLRGF